MEYIFSLSRPNFCHSYSEWTPPTANVNKRVFFFRDVLFLWRTGSLEAFGGTHCCSMPTIFRHINCRYLRAFEQFSRIAFFFVGEGKGVDGGRGGGRSGRPIFCYFWNVSRASMRRRSLFVLYCFGYSVCGNVIGTQFNQNARNRRANQRDNEENKPKKQNEKRRYQHRGNPIKRTEMIGGE